MSADVHLSLRGNEGFDARCRTLRVPNHSELNTPQLIIEGWDIKITLELTPDQLEEIQDAIGTYLGNNHVAEDITPAATDLKPFDKEVSERIKDKALAGIASVTISNWDGSERQAFYPAEAATDAPSDEADDMPEMGPDGWYTLPDHKGSIYYNPDLANGLRWVLWLSGGTQTHHTTAGVAWEYFKSRIPRLDADDLLGGIAWSLAIAGDEA